MSDGHACLVSAACFVRGLPLFLRASPRTPLRVFGIIALDTLHVLRHSRPLPRARIDELAMFLDLEGCTNALWDHKGLCASDYLALRHRLEAAGLGPRIKAYLRQLRDFESRRPAIGGDERHFHDVRQYREGVARLAIETAAGIALNGTDCDVETLFRILMQCQIIDDVMDYREDLAAGLPSFLTAAASLPQAMELTAGAARHYGARAGRSSRPDVLPLRIALHVVTALTRLIIRVAERRRHNIQPFSLDGLERETHR